jgi:hypothetical protein
MEIIGFLEKVSDEQSYETSLLLAENNKPTVLRKRLSRWIRNGMDR